MPKDKKSDKKSSKSSDKKSSKSKDKSPSSKSAKSAKSSPADAGDAASAAAPSTPGVVPSVGAPSGSPAASAGAGINSADFDAGQLFERYNSTGDNGMALSDFQRMARDLGLKPPPSAGAPPGTPSPRTDFEAGRLFERFDRNHSGMLERDEFNRMVRELEAAHQRGVSFGGAAAPPLPPATAALASAGPDEFSAGRLFERYDATHKGSLSRQDFRQMVGALRTGETLPRGPSGAGAAPMQPPYGSSPAYGGSHDAGSFGGAALYGGGAESYRAKLGSLASVSATLMAKRERIMQQAMKVQARMEEIKAARRAIERETTADLEAILHRLRSAESFKLSLLSHDLDELQVDLNAIDGFQAQFASVQPRPQPLDSLRRGGGGGYNYDPSQAAAFLGRFPELAAEADRLAAKPVKLSVDVAADDFDREVFRRNEAARRAESALELVRTKDQMIWNLLREREQALKDLQELSNASSHEMAEWVTLTDRVTEELDRFKMACAICNAPLNQSTINNDCPLNGPANRRAGDVDGGAAGDDKDDERDATSLRGSGRHYFVPLAPAGAGAAKGSAAAGSGAASGAGGGAAAPGARGLRASAASAPGDLAPPSRSASPTPGGGAFAGAGTNVGGGYGGRGQAPVSSSWGGFDGDLRASYGSAGSGGGEYGHTFAGPAPPVPSGEPVYGLSFAGRVPAAM